MRICLTSTCSFFKSLVLIIGCLMLSINGLQAQTIDPDDVSTAFELLHVKREQVRHLSFPPDARIYHQMMDLGMWEELSPLLAANSSSHEQVLLAKARFAWLNNDFAKASQFLELSGNHNYPQTQLLKAQLEIEAWRLDSAEKICLRLLEELPRHEAAVLQLGRIYLLKKNYPKARALAEQVIQWNDQHAQAYLLLADAYFWQQEPEKAIEPLRTSLRLDPWNADARFAYGYAIWRQVDATLLPQMAAQWELALAVNPLHFMTHWHWGNGHTHLTFTDYQDPKEDTIRTLLTYTDKLFSEGRVAESFEELEQWKKIHQDSSVYLDLAKGSYAYVASQMGIIQSEFDPDYLELAAQTFRSILRKKAHFGPAHNGLAAVIKQKRFSYLHQYPQLEQAISQTTIEDSSHFFTVFPDLGFYPGDRVAKMVWQQLHTGVVYMPFLSRLGKTFVIPPLHEDLALAMNNPYFRGGTTFDNRQWMDIRGVGTGATGIEYVERGAHLERNVTLHEFVHLFHMFLFTDAETREVRKRYFHAMKEGLTLDYYSANNEFEYFAQTFPAYFIPLKAHPLNHKSLNTQSDLASKDSLMYSFIDNLVAKHRAYLAGDSSAMADTWAQTYLVLAREARSNSDWATVEALLDTAFHWDTAYLPVHLEFSKSLMLQGKMDQAKRWLEKAVAIQEEYAPIYVHYAHLERERFLDGLIPEAEAIREQARYFRKAQELEDDLYSRAEINQEFREAYLNFCRIPEAIETAEAYTVQAPEISTDLRRHRLRANSFAKQLKGEMGYVDEVLDYFQQQYDLRPQDFHLLAQYADLLLLADQAQTALPLLKQAYELLMAAKDPRPDIFLQLARAYQATDRLQLAQSILQKLIYQPLSPSQTLDMIPLLIAAGLLEEAKKLMAPILLPSLPYDQAKYHFAQGCLAEAEGQLADMDQKYQMCLTNNPYHWQARFRWIEQLNLRGERAKSKYLAQQGMVLPLPPGPIWAERLAVILAKAKN